MMTDSVEIRKIVQADYEDWESLWKSYLDFYNAERSKDIFRLTFYLLRCCQMRICVFPRP